MRAVSVLANQFNADVWEDYLQLCRQNLSSPAHSSVKALTRKTGSEDLAIVLFYRLGDYASEWLNVEVPALDNKRPVDLIKSEKGAKAVREALLRMPD